MLNTRGLPPAGVTEKTTVPFGVAPLPVALKFVEFNKPPVGAMVALSGPATLKLKAGDALPSGLIAWAVHRPARSNVARADALFPSVEICALSGERHRFAKHRISCALDS